MAPATKRKLQSVLVALGGLGLWALAAHHLVGSSLRCSRTQSSCELQRGLLGTVSHPLSSFADPSAHEGSGKNDRDSVRFSLGGSSYELDVADFETAELEAVRAQTFLTGRTSDLTLEAHRSKYLIGSSLLFGLLAGWFGIDRWRARV